MNGWEDGRTPPRAFQGVSVPLLLVWVGLGLGSWLLFALLGLGCYELAVHL